MKQETVNDLISRAFAIEEVSPKDAGAIGFMGRALVQATMPHKKQNTNEFIRKNGAFTLTMLAPSNVGLPYGSIPRLLMMWLTTEAVRTKEKELVLGKTLREFMGQLGLQATGGRWGSITALKEQMRRLFSSSISCHYAEGYRDSGLNLQIAEEYQLWWNPTSPDQLSLWESKVTLGTKFFNEIINNPVPLDMRVIKAIRRSPMALDMYCWLTYRMSYLRSRTNIPWPVLQTQFGADYGSNDQGVRDFKRAFMRELKKIYLFYPEVRLEFWENGISLLPGRSHISPRKNK
jgi:hypothetical protein